MSTRFEAATFTGALGDGRSAASRSCEVRLAAHGLEVRPEPEARWRLWPYHQLHAGVPLHADAPDVLLSLKPAGAETLFVAHAGFVRELLARAPTLSAGRQRWQGLKPGLAVAASVLALSLGVWTLDLHPAQAVARAMPQKTRQALGRNVVEAVAREHKPCRAPAARAALDRLTRRLAAAASSTPLEVHVEVLDWPLVNAFAAPGGQIILTRGLIEQAASPDEVAGVLAHELGHALELHPESGIVRALGLGAASQLLLAGSSGTISNIGVVLAHLRYTRLAEREADAHALRILKGAGIASKGLGDFFERLEGKRPFRPAGKGSRPPALEVLRTHPSTPERIARVRAEPPYPATPALSAADWQALRDACGRAAPPPAPPRPAAGDADRDIAEASKALEANPDDLAALQRRARAYAGKRQHELAAADLTRALALAPGDAGLHVARGLAHQSLRRYEAALADFDAAVRLAPGHAAARNGRGNANRALKRYEAALTDFDELIRNHPGYAAGYYNRALVHLDQQRQEDAVRDFTAAIAADKDYAGAYTQRGLLREKAGEREQAVADFRAALAAPAKYESGAWAHRTARARLAALGIAAP